MDLIKHLNWRYAVKRMSDRKVPEHIVNDIVEAVRLTPTSIGLQPFRLLLVKDQAVKAELAKHSFNPQVAESSHLLVFAAFDAVKESHIDNLVSLMATTRNTSTDTYRDYEQKIKSHLLAQTPEQHFTWSARQAYIGLGTAIVAAAAHEVDATPMEGFDAAKYDEILGLKEKGLRSVVLLALGYRDEKNDYLLGAKKVRLPKEDFVIEY